MSSESNPGPTLRPRTPIGVHLAGTGMALPARRVSNEDLAKFVDTSDEWITQRTGIRSRHLIGDGESLRQMCVDALKQALERAQLKPTDLDLVLCATLTPEMACPSLAARVVAEVGAVPAGATDLSAACSGFVYGLNLGWSMVHSGFYRNVAVIGGEVLSNITDWKDRTTCVLFGDGAGAAILSACPDPNRGCLYQSMASDGNLWKHLYVPRTEKDIPADANFNGALNTLQMNGREVYKFAVTTLQHCIDNALSQTGIKADDLAMIIPHQSNMRILESARERLGLSPEKLYINIDRYGNTSAASVPICLHELMQSQRLKTGDLVLLVALGGGLTWSSSLWRL